MSEWLDKAKRMTPTDDRETYAGANIAAIALALIAIAEVLELMVTPPAPIVDPEGRF